MFIVAIYKLHKHANIRFHCIDIKKYKNTTSFSWTPDKERKKRSKAICPSHFTSQFLLLMENSVTVKTPLF